MGRPVPLTANIRWESTLIADAGNNRILEVDRPLIRFLNPNTGLDLQQIPGTMIMLAQGYQYRPDVTLYRSGADQTSSSWCSGRRCWRMPIRWRKSQQAGRIPCSPKPLMFTTAQRYSDAQNITMPTQFDVDPVMSGVRTCELLATVGNPVPDPYTANAFVRTVHLSTVRSFRRSVRHSSRSCRRAFPR